MMMMRKVTLLVLLVVFGWSSGAWAVPVITNGLVAGWEFEGNANDVSGNGHHGTVVGAILTTDRHGTPDSAYRFNGSDDRITLAPVFGDQQDPFTFSAWIRTEAAGGMSLYGEFQSSGSTRNYVTASVGPSITLDNYLPSGGQIGFNLGAPDPSTSFDNVWIHLALTVDSGLASGYINGDFIASVPYTEIYSSGTPTIAAIGSRNLNGWSSRGHAGEIDSLYLYNRALSASEVQTLFSVVPEPNTALLLGFGLIGIAVQRKVS